jgi:hypothetical protein
LGHRVELGFGGNAQYRERKVLRAPQSATIERGDEFAGRRVRDWEEMRDSRVIRLFNRQLRQGPKTPMGREREYRGDVLCHLALVEARTFADWPEPPKNAYLLIELAVLIWDRFRLPQSEERPAVSQGDAAGAHEASVRPGKARRAALDTRPGFKDSASSEKDAP